MSLEIFAAGACLLSAPFAELIRSRRVSNSWSQRGGTMTPGVYTLDEALQLIRFMQGDFKIAPMFRDLCGLELEENQAELIGCLNGADAVLVEINSPVAIQYSRYALSRARLIGSLLNRLKSTTEMARTSNAWYNQGLMAGNSQTRAETAQRLARMLPVDLPNLDLARAVLLDSRPYHRDFNGLVEGLEELRDAFRAPLGVVTYTHQYMPDGRPLPWPSDFVDLTIAAAKQLNLPVFHPADFVRSYGVGRALLPDRVHYQAEFSAVLAEPLWEFTKSLVGEPCRNTASGQTTVVPESRLA